MIQAMARIQPILQHAVFTAVLEQLENWEQDRIYCRHGLPHLLDVARIASLRADDQHMDYPRDVIYAAALLHDIGRLAQYTTGEPHAQAGVPLARRILQDTEFTAEEQDAILRAVRGHQTGETDALTRLICEADHACRLCFCCTARGSCKWTKEQRNRTVLL